MTPTQPPASRRAVTWVLVWTAIALLFVGQNVLGDVSAGRGIRWFSSVLQELLYWLPFAAATPLFVHMAERFPIEGRSEGITTRHSLTRHLAAAVVFATLQPWLSNLMTNAAAHLVFASDAARTARIAQSLARIYPVEVVIALWKYAVVIAVISATRYYRATQEARVRTVELEQQVASAQLGALRMQLNPHFLFNTLNSVSMLAQTEPARTRSLLVELADLLRVTLSSSSTAEVPLRDELAFIDRYLGIERVRFEDRLVVKLDVGESTEDLLVPSLILQPLVENSIRHGLAGKRDALHLAIRSRIHGDRLVLEVEDDGSGVDGDRGVRPAFGIGLTNVERRLHAANGSDTPIEFDRNGSPSGLVVRLKLPVRRPALLPLA